MSFFSRTRLSSPVVFFVVLLVSPAFAGTLFTPADPPKTRLAEREPAVMRVRYVHVDETALPSPKARNTAITMNLFEDVALSVQAQKQRVKDEDVHIWNGKVQDWYDGSAILVSSKGITMGNIHTPDGLYEIRYAGEGVHMVREMDPSKFPPEGEPIIPPPPADEDAAVFRNARPRAADNGDYIDLLIVYTQAARAAVGGTTAMENLIDLGVEESNQSFANSNVVQRFRLIYKQEVNYTEPAGADGFSQTIQELQRTSDGVLDEVHTLRDSAAADLVSLWSNNTDLCGKGYSMNGNYATTWDFAPWAFTVVRYSCISNYSFSHETGHNMGCQHNTEDSSSDGAFSYSHGWRDATASPAFRTIMSYDCDGSSCARVNYWSNPNVTVNGKPAGTSSADNARSLDELRARTAGHRDSDSAIIPTVTQWSALLLALVCSCILFSYIQRRNGKRFTRV